MHFSRILNLYKWATDAFITKTKIEEFNKTDTLLILCSFLKRLYEINEIEGKGKNSKKITVIFIILNLYFKFFH